MDHLEGVAWLVEVEIREVEPLKLLPTPGSSMRFSASKSSAVWISLDDCEDVCPCWGTGTLWAKINPKVASARYFITVMREVANSLKAHCGEGLLGAHDGSQGGLWPAQNPRLVYYYTCVFSDWALNSLMDKLFITKHKIAPVYCCFCDFGPILFFLKHFFDIYLVSSHQHSPWSPWPCGPRVSSLPFSSKLHSAVGAWQDEWVDVWVDLELGVPRGCHWF